MVTFFEESTEECECEHADHHDGTGHPFLSTDAVDVRLIRVRRGHYRLCMVCRVRHHGEPLPSGVVVQELCDHDRHACPDCIDTCRLCAVTVPSDDGSALMAHVATEHVIGVDDCKHCGRVMGH